MSRDDCRGAKCQQIGVTGLDRIRTGVDGQLQELLVRRIATGATTKSCRSVAIDLNRTPSRSTTSATIPGVDIRFRGPLIKRERRANSAAIAQRASDRLNPFRKIRLSAVGPHGDGGKSV
jgi:hypothetical protein